jgi:membrane-bound lytic murein transglycosylase D
MFHDWQMVLAAYNGGPGTVNKAIRRSGGKKTYWEIRPYLPLETQGYVPAFIAVNYVMNHTSEHNLYPLAPKQIYFLTDTVIPSQAVNFDQLSTQLNLPVEDIQYLNPGYKKMMVPFTGLEKYHLCLPVSKIGQFLNNEATIYAMSKQSMPVIETEDLISKDVRKTHVVRRGESIFAIAKKYNCTAQQIRSWNNIKGNSVHSGKKLIVYMNPNVNEQPKTEAIAVKKAEAVADSTVETKTLVAAIEQAAPVEKAVVSKTAKTPNKFIYYTVQRGDTLWEIASRYNGLTVDRLKKLNGINSGKALKAGMKLKVGLSG